MTINDTAIIFDLDGTIINTDELIKQSYIHTFKKYKPSYTLTNEELLTFLGPSLNEIFSKYFDENEKDNAIKYYREYTINNHSKYVTIYPTVKDTIIYLKNKGYKLAIVTTKLKKIAIIGLQLFDLQNYFDIIIGCDDVTYTKPHPEGILKALNFLKCTYGYYIGDNASDIIAGKKANLFTIGVNWSPKGYKELLNQHPDVLVNSMNQIITYIEKKGEKNEFN